MLQAAGTLKAGSEGAKEEENERTGPPVGAGIGVLTVKIALRRCENGQAVYSMKECRIAWNLTGSHETSAV